jgi:hypothetical protein
MKKKVISLETDVDDTNNSLSLFKGDSEYVTPEEAKIVLDNVGKHITKEEGIFLARAMHSEWDAKCNTLKEEISVCFIEKNKGWIASQIRSHKLGHYFECFLNLLLFVFRF